MIRRLALTLLLVAASGGDAAIADDPPAAIPAVFSSITLTDALAKSKQNNSVVVADFTAEWCAPCKMMERTVFPDARVEKWVKDHGAVMVRIDTDKEPALAREYGVTAWPTFIGFKNGQMVDRRLGSMTTDQFLMWLELVDRAGKAAPGMETIVRPAPAPADALTFGDRLKAARGAMDSGLREKAQRDFLGLWSETVVRDAERSAPERMVLTDALQTLAERHAPAREAIAAERDRLEGVLKTDARAFEALDGWIHLNEALREESKTLAWYDRIRDDSDSKATLTRMSGLVRGTLARADRWDDVVRVVADPMKTVEVTYSIMNRAAMPQHLDESRRNQMREVHLRSFREEAAGMYAGLLMAGRDEEAASLAAGVMKLDDTPTTRVMLVAKAVQKGQPRRAQGALLDEAERAGRNVGELRKKIEASPK
jgi:thiol-disulfide isomerase/thioredoxin